MPTSGTLNTRGLPFVAKLIAKAIATISGGTANQPAAWSPTPDQIDSVIGQLKGGTVIWPKRYQRVAEGFVQQVALEH